MSVKHGPFIFIAIVIASCLILGASLVVFFKDVPALVVSVILACAVASLLYGALGGVTSAGFGFGPLKLTGSGAVLLGGVWLFNYLLAPQLEEIRNDHRLAQFAFNKYADPSQGWFAINERTGVPVAVKFIDPVTDSIVEKVQVPTSASLPLKLVAEKGTGRYLVLGVDAKADEGLGYVYAQNLAGWKPGTVYGFQRLYVARQGNLPRGMKRRWGNTICRGKSMPFEIKVVRFQDGFADYDLTRCDAPAESKPDHSSSLASGDGEIVKLKMKGEHRSFLVAIVAADHRHDPPWSTFLVIEMEASTS